MEQSSLQAVSESNYKKGYVSTYPFMYVSSQEVFMLCNTKSPTFIFFLGFLIFFSSYANAYEDWAGSYVGIQVGYADADLELKAVDVPRPSSGWSYPDFGGLNGLTFDDSLKGALAGVLAGYRWEQNDWVYGLEGTYSLMQIDAKDWTRADDKRAPIPDGGIVSKQDDVFDNKLRSLLTMSASLGKNFNGLLIYAKAGFATGHLRAKVSDHNIDRNGVDTGNNIGGGSDEQWLNGYTLGTGARYRLDEKWSLGGEYQYVRLTGSNINPGGTGCFNTGAGSAACSSNGGAFSPVKYEMDPEINLHSLMLNLNYHF